MPLYEYECDSCLQRFEKIRKFSDPPLEACGLCGGGPIRKLFSSPAIQFKGSGFYITDYAKKSATDGDASGGAKGASDSSETKPASPSASSDTKESTSTSSSDKGKSDSSASGSSAMPAGESAAAKTTTKTE